MKIRPADITNESATNGWVLTLVSGVPTWQAAAGGGGSGTVTTVSVVSTNGVSGTVTNATTTPAISITLGAITPSSVAATGTVTGSNLSGTNTGDQTTVSGNAGSATVLQTARTINGVSFDGSANISVNTNNSVTWDNSGTGAASGATFNGSAAKTISYNTIGAQASSAQLTALAGAAWSAGTQVVTLTAANTVTLKTVGQATGNILDKAAGDALYQAIGSYAPASGSANYQAASANLTAYAGGAWSAGVQVPSLTAANTVTLKTVGSATGNILDKASGDSLYAPVSGSANYAPKLPQVYTNASVSGAVTVDGGAYDTFILTATANVTSVTVGNQVAGKKYEFWWKQDSTGSRTIVPGSGFKFGTDVTAYTASTTASKTDLMGCWSDGTNMYIVGVAKGY